MVQGSRSPFHDAAPHPPPGGSNLVVTRQKLGPNLESTRGRRPLRAVRGVVFGDHTHEAVALDQADVVVVAGASHRGLRGELLDRERLLDQGSKDTLPLGMADDLQRFDMSTCVRRSCPFYAGWRALPASSAITSRSLRTWFFEPYGRFGIQHQAIDDIQCLLRPTRNEDLLADAIDVFARAQMRGDRFA